MATSGIVKTNTTYDSYFWVKWNYVSQDTSLISTIINWSCGVKPGHKFYSNAVKMSAVTINGSKVYAGGTYSNITDYKERTLASGTLEVNHDADGSKTLTVSAFSGQVWKDTSYLTATAAAQSFQLPSILVWTDCTAPTSVSISDDGQEVAIPGDTITISWSGAKGGTNNNITSYDVYYHFSSNKTAPTSSSYSGYKSVPSSSTSITISVTEANRGLYLRASVRAVSKYNTTGLTSSSEGSSIPINRRPNPPSIPKLSWIYKSTGSGVTITNISAGVANFGSNEQEVWYSSSESQMGIAKVSGNEQTVTKEGAYYFWTWDGREYSNSYTKVTVSKNTKPEITVVLSDSSYSTVFGYENVLETAKFSISANKVCNYSLKIKDTEDVLLYALKNNSNLPTEISFTQDIRSLGLPEREYYFEFSCADDIEEGNSIKITPKNSYYVSPPLPQFSKDKTFNQFLSSSISKTKATDFYKELRFETSFYDSYLFDHGIFRLDNGSNESIGYLVTKKKDSEKIIYDVTITSNLTPGKNYDFIPTLQLAGLTSSLLIPLRRCPVLDPTPSSGSSLYIKPFTDGWNRAENKEGISNKEISISKGSFGGKELEKFYEEYNIDPNSNNWWESEIITPDNKPIVVTDLISGGSLDGDYYKRDFTITGSNFYNKISAGLSKQGILSCILKNTITNLFGETISRQSSIVTLDLNEASEIISLDRTNEMLVGGAFPYLYEGYELKLKYSIRSFSSNKIQYSYLIDRNDGKGTVTYGEGAENEDTSVPEFGIGRVLTKEVSITIGEIQQSQSCDFNMIFYDGNSTIYDDSKKITCERIRLVEPAFSFDKAVYISEEDPSPGKVNCQYTISDWGYEPSQKNLFTSSFSIELNLSTKEKETENISSTIFSLDNKIDNFKIGRLTLTVILNYNGETLEKSSTSNDLIIYGITPTVAYRQNHLGINTFAIGEHDILTVAPTSGRNVIAFIKDGASDEIMTLNLKTGMLSGFCFSIDCGEITET